MTTTAEIVINFLILFNLHLRFTHELQVLFKGFHANFRNFKPAAPKPSMPSRTAAGTGTGTTSTLNAVPEGIL
jgi:hypothetical protein